MKRLFGMSIAVLLWTALVAPAADARQYPIGGPVEPLAHMTFSGAFQLPGVTLPAGTYTFERVAPNVTQVRSRDHSTSYGMFMTIPTLRAGHIENPLVVMSEARAGEMPRVEAWFPLHGSSNVVHQTLGYEFRY